MQQEIIMTIPTMLTLSRIMITPIVVYSIIASWWQAALITFSCAMLTDLFDGMLARRLNIVSVIGAYLDPLADKILIVSCFLAFTTAHARLLAIPVWLAGLIVIKELVLIVGAAALLIYCGPMQIRPSMVGKVGTCIQGLFIAWLCLCSIFEWHPVRTYYVFLCTIIIFTIGSLLHYGWAVIRSQFVL